MSKKMLIDATHSEETRVAVVSENTLEDYDFESILRKSLKGNIYLAKVTRVEPSLQAAFVNFGGNRHGFLPFSEIHPDYYKIPVADREALMAEQEELARQMEEDENTTEEDVEDNEAEEQTHDDESADVEEAETSEEEDGDDVKKKKSPKKKTTRRSKKIAEAKIEDDEIIADDIAPSDDETPKKPKRTRRKAAKKAKESKEVDGNVKPSEDEDVDGNVKEEPKTRRRRRKKDDQKQDQETESKDQDSDKSDDSSEDGDGSDKKRRSYRGRRGRRGGRNRRGGARGRHRVKEVGGGDDYDDDGQTALWKKIRRSYKIQEVIKRGQIMLVQVQKEERGNKGAAVTSYISLPGRYSVLMPNSPRGGGVSRKIPFKERKKLKDILNDLTIPKAMSIIIRTAGIGRTKAEIKRDLDYLYKLWDSIRDLTLKSTAPALVYEEGNLVKRAIRDIYTRDIEEIHVAGEEGYKTAKDFMKMMIASHAKRIHRYADNDELPLFHRYQVESQIDEIYSNQAQLPSGGYLVINPTEALVSVDVNSGRATKERHIEETALKTNMEAAVEVARQLRLRDLGGLVVIDFIDMEDYRNNRKVERQLAEALSVDRARVQMGRISNFGLMELSRQRLRPSLAETHFQVCSHCNGRGHVPTTDVAALRILRAIEEEGIKHRSAEIQVQAPTDVVNYLVNNKRQKLSEIEKRYDFKVQIEMNADLGPSDYEIEQVKAADPKKAKAKQQAQKSNDDKKGQGRPKSKKSDIKTESKPEADEKPKTRGRRKKSDDTNDVPKEDKKSQKKQIDIKVADTQIEDPKPEVSNDTGEAEKEAKSEAPKHSASVEYETVNQKPKKKKKGWWNRLIES